MSEFGELTLVSRALSKEVGGNSLVYKNKPDFRFIGLNAISKKEMGSGNDL